MNWKRIKALMLVIAIVFAMTGCNMKSINKETRTIVDITGAEIEVPTNVSKVINLNPFGCQIMLGIGLDDYLIGISQDTFETEWLELICPKAKSIPTYSDETSAETLLAAGADIVFSQDPDVAENLRNKGIPCITFGYLTLDDFKYNIRLIGDILGGEAKEKTDKYISYLDNKIEDVESFLSGVITDKETVHYINANGDKGFYKTSGEGSTTDCCAKASFVKLATASLIVFPESKVDAEALLATNPENVVIGGKYQHVIYDEILKADEWKNIEAIKNGNVYKIPMGLAAWDRYCLETALLIPWLASIVYPEHYEFDEENEIIEFYKTFMDYELSDIQVQYMIAGLTPNGDKEITSR